MHATKGKGRPLYIGIIEATLCLMVLAGCMTGNGSGSPSVTPTGDLTTHLIDILQAATGKLVQ